MKKFLQILVTAALAVMPAGAFADNDNPCFGWVSYSADSKVSGAPVKGSLFDGEMPCDDSRTVYDQGIDVYYGGNKGFREVHSRLREARKGCRPLHFSD